MAFNVHILTRLAHLQATHLWGLPLALFLADEVLERPTRRNAIALGLAIAATAATSLYTLALACIAAVVVAIVGVRRWRGALTVVLATLAGLILALPVLLPYARLARGAVRPLEMVAQFSATLTGYLTSTSWVHTFWSPAVTNSVDVLFPGATAIILAAIGVTRIADPTARRRLLTLVVLAGAGVLLSLGPATRTVRLAVRSVHAAPRDPSDGAIRDAAAAGRRCRRGLWGGQGRARRSRQCPAAAARRSAAGRGDAGGLAGSAPDHSPGAHPGDLQVRPRRTRSDAARRAPVLSGRCDVREQRVRLERDRALAAGDERLQRIHARFLSAPRARLLVLPEEWAIAAIKQEGTTHVMVHLERFGAEADAVRQAVDRRADLELVAADGAGHRLYKIK